MIAAVALGKNPSKATPSHAFIIIFNVRLEYGLRKMIILVNNGSKENFISQRFVKENDLIGDPIGRMGESIDGYAVTIYGKHDLVTHIKDSGNQNQTNVVNFLAADMERYDIILRWR
jgi:hypothetical protein